MDTIKVKNFIPHKDIHVARIVLITHITTLNVLSVLYKIKHVLILNIKYLKNVIPVLLFCFLVYSSPEVHLKIAELAKEYGPIVRLSVGVYE